MSRKVVMSLVLVIGLGIGAIVPMTTAWWYGKDRLDLASNDINVEAVIEPIEIGLARDTAAKVIYHFEVNQGILSVIEGKPGVNGKVIVTGLDVKTWPKEIIEMAPKVEFYSLDEVQSFIDTANEPLWQE